jgi:hypothetical protein
MKTKIKTKITEKDLEITLPKEETRDCEKCGGETTNHLSGDEMVAFCKDCKWITYFK